MSSILEFFQLKLDCTESKLYNITVCTIHQSKGLEFDDVILLQEFKSNKSSDTVNAENVAVSRAKQNFLLLNINSEEYSRIALAILHLQEAHKVSSF